MVILCCVASVWCLGVVIVVVMVILVTTVIAENMFAEFVVIGAVDTNLFVVIVFGVVIGPTVIA